MNMARLLSALCLLCLLAGCSRFRFVIDAVPAMEDLTETTVLDDRDGGFLPGRANKIALIDVTGTLEERTGRSILTAAESPVGRFAEALRKAAADRAVKAVIIRINSRGGAVTASDIMYRELASFRAKSGKPAVILMGDVAASGAYYLACAGDTIIANPTTITGSIGVIMQMFDVSEGMQRIGITSNAIVSGPNKAVASPFEPMSPEHRAILQAIVDEFYERFLSVVKDARPKLAEAELASITDGRVVTGATALELGLVDALGDLREAFDEAKSRASLRRARLVKYHRPLEHVGSAYAEASAPAATQVNLLQLNLPSSMMGENSGFYYFWDPTAW
jgi:protease-4